MSNIYRTKPMTLYVFPNGISEVTPEHFGVDAERVIDIELNENDAVRLRDYLQERLNVEVYGAISFRLRGRLVI